MTVSRVALLGVMLSLSSRRWRATGRPAVETLRRRPSASPTSCCFRCWTGARLERGRCHERRSGSAVGTSRAPTRTGRTVRYSKAVLLARRSTCIDLRHRLAGSPIDGTGGRASAVDVNEAGRRGRAVASIRGLPTGWARSAGGCGTTAPPPASRSASQRPFAVVRSLNDHGVAVGYVSDFTTRVPLDPLCGATANGSASPSRLAHAGWRTASTTATWSSAGPSFHVSERRRWYSAAGGQQRSAARSERLPQSTSSTWTTTAGSWAARGARRRVQRGYLWEDGPQSRAASLVGNHAFAFAWDMNDDGDLTGYRGGFLGVGNRACGLHLGAETVDRAPFPQGPWEQVRHGPVGHHAARRGSPPTAVSAWETCRAVSGPDDGRATIWTCTQTY